MSDIISALRMRNRELARNATDEADMCRIRGALEALDELEKETVQHDKEE
jgi:hypothetical protein